MAQRDWFTETFGAAVTDIRQKVVEEGWFGRAVTPAASPTPDPAPRSLDELLGWGLPSEERDRSPGRERPAAPGTPWDIDHDR